MASARRAVIDVGTNSVKLLVAEVAGHGVRPLWEGSEQTRLGAGLYETRRLQPGPVARTAGAVARFAQTARQWNADSIRVIATSAARDALNAGELVAAIAAASGLAAEIISGEQEAEWAFQGVATDPALAGRPLLLLDVGGGSTEFILGRGEHKHFSASFPLGTVRLLERLPHSDPPASAELAACRKTARDFLSREVQPRLGPAMERETALNSGEKPLLVGTGGTATVLARMETRMTDFDRARIEATRLGREQLSAHVARLWGMPLAERRRVVGLPPNRADVILTGVVIYEAVMERLEFEELRVSTRGLRFAAAMDKT